MNIQTFKPSDVKVDLKLPTTTDIVEGVRQEQNGGTPSNVSTGESVYSRLSRLSQPVTFGKPGEINLAETSIPISAVYTKLRDGSYDAMYKNYKGAFGNEDRLAREQGVIEKATKGVARFGSKVGIYALDATVGTATGIVQAIQDKSFSSLWDNDFSNMMDDWNTRLDNSLPIYYTDEYKSKNILGQIIDSPMTFLFKDVADGLAFVGGAMLPEVAIAAATGGASLSTTAARWSAKMALKSGQRNLAKKLLRQSAKQKLTGGALDLVKTAGFVARTSNFEAGMEARHNFHDAVEKYHLDFEELNGRQPTMEEMKDFYELARSSANGVYTANMALLSVSNIAMFGKTFGIDPFKVSQKLTRSANKFIGLSPKISKGGQLVMPTATKGQKFAGRAYNFLSKPAIEGIYEEGLQGVAGETMQKYLESKYNPDYAESYGFSSALVDGLAHTYGSKEGWKEIGIGMIIGWLAPGLQGQGFAGFGKASYKSKRSEVEKAVVQANKSHEAFRENFIAGMNNADAALAFREKSLNLQEEEIREGKIPTTDDIDIAVITKEYIQSQSRFKTQEEIQEDYELIINSTELSPEVKETLSADGVSESDYKSQLVNNFKEVSKDYNRAKKMVERLGIDGSVKFDKATEEYLESVSPEGKKANKGLIADYLITSFVVGSAAKRSGIQLGKDIESFVGERGLASALNFYSTLASKKDSKVSELDQKKKELKEKEDLFQEVGLELSRLSGQRSQSNEANELNSRYQEIGEQHATLTQQITNLKSEVEQLSNQVRDEYKASELYSNIQDSSTDLSMVDPVTYLDQIQKLDKYIADLREAGENQKADTLEYLLSQFKDQMDAAREMENLAVRMGDANFFSSKRGQGLIGSIIGTRYEMPEDLKKLIDKNNEIFDKEFQKRGYAKEGLSTSQRLEKIINEDSNLSERDKYKISTLLRLELDVRERVQTAHDRLQSREEAAAEVTTEIPTSETEGEQLFPSDNVRTAIRKVIDEDAETTLDRYNKLIDELLAAVDKLRGENRRQEREETENQIQILEEQKRTLEEEQESSENQLKLKEVEDKIAELKDKLKELKTARIINSEDHKRLNELNEKSMKEPLTTDEQVELENLEADINRWIDITGTVVDGYRLSDLLKLRAQLEATDILSLEDVAIINAQKVLENIDFGQKKRDSNYDLTQTYGAVTAIGLTKGKESFVSLQGITLEDLESELPEGFSLKVDTESFPEENDRGNIVLSQQEVERINSETSIRVLPKIENLNTNYSLVVKVKRNNIAEPIQSSHSRDFTTPMTPDKVYEANEGDDITLEIDTKDSYNQELIQEYNEATQEEKKDVLTKIKNKLVIRVIHNGNFVGVLKGNRKPESVQDLTFEAMRKSIGDNAVLILLFSYFFNLFLNNLFFIFR